MTEEKNQTIVTSSAKDVASANAICDVMWIERIFEGHKFLMNSHMRISMIVKLQLALLKILFIAIGPNMWTLTVTSLEKGLIRGLSILDTYQLLFKQPTFSQNLVLELTLKK